jgi:hypothetical protein
MFTKRGRGGKLGLMLINSRGKSQKPFRLPKPDAPRLLPSWAVASLVLPWLLADCWAKKTIIFSQQTSSLRFLEKLRASGFRNLTFQRSDVSFYGHGNYLKLILK